MNVVVTMGGAGSRFLKAGYTVPKYEISVLDKTLFEWSMMSLAAFHHEKHIFLVKQADNARSFIEAHSAALDIGNITIVEIDHLTGGQAETAMLASSEWSREEDLLIYNIDTYVTPNVMNYDTLRGNGCIPCFNAPGEHWSFVKLNSDGRAIEVREKTRISEHCSIGAYYFKTCSLYEHTYHKLYEESDYVEKGEKYIAPLYNVLISEGCDIFIQDIASRDVHVLGTPEEVKLFESSFKNR